MPKKSKPIFSQKVNSTWKNAEGKEVPIESYSGAPKPIQNLSSYLSGGYRFSELRKRKMRGQRNMKTFLGALIPEIQQEFHMTRRINNFKKS